MRTILFVLALLGATVGRGQIVLDWYTPAATGGGLLLDDYPNAAAAYSLRLLNSAYTGNCIVVQKRATSDTLAIGFSSGYLDTAAIATFCSGTDCDVRRWYDQSGNGRDVVQNTGTNQPNIYTSGALQEIGGKKAIKGDGNNDVMRVLFSRPQPHSAFYVGTIGASDIAIDDGTVSNNASLSTASNQMRIGARTVVLFSSFSVAQNTVNYSLVSGLWNGASSQAQVNNTSASGSLGTNNSDGLSIFAAGNDAGSNIGFTQEVVIYNSNNTADWSGIQSNINAFYNVY
jgi:hypothetical protein